MKHQLPPLVSRALAVGLLLLLALLIHLSVIQPLYALYRGNSETLETLQHRLGAYRAVAARRGQLEEQLERMVPAQEESDLFLKSATQPLAAAELQAYVRRIVEGADGNLLSLQPITSGISDEAGTQVAVRVRLTGGTGTVLESLYRLESGRPLVLVDALSMSQRSRGRPGAGAAGDAGGDLDVRFDLTGFLRGAQQ